MSKEDVVLHAHKTAKCIVDKGYIGTCDYTVKDGDIRLSVTRFSAEDAWDDAYDRLVGKLPKLEQWV